MLPLIWRARRPLGLVVTGAAASGKTMLAIALANASGFEHLSSDVIRKQAAGRRRRIAPPRRYMTPRSPQACGAAGDCSRTT